MLGKEVTVDYKVNGLLEYIFNNFEVQDRSTVIAGIALLAPIWFKQEPAPERTMTIDVLVTEIVPWADPPDIELVLQRQREALDLEHQCELVLQSQREARALEQEYERVLKSQREALDPQHQ